MNKTAVILLNHKEYARKFLPDCIQSLRKINLPKESCQIFIIDNESTPESVSLLKKLAPEAKIVTNKTNLGFAGGYNQGIKQINLDNFKYLYLLNMDTAVEPDFLEKAIKVYESDPKIASVQSRLMLFDDKTKINSLGNRVHFLMFGFSEGYQEEYKGTSDQGSGAREINYGSGAGLLISKNIYEKFGLFNDEFFMYHEDLELGLKYKLAGYKNVLVEDSIVYHKYEFSRSVKKYYWMERNRFIVALTYLKVSTLILLFPAWLIMEAGQFLFALKGGWAGKKLKVYWWFLNFKNWCRIVKWRKQAQKIRKISDYCLMKDFAAEISYQEIDSWALRLANKFFKLYWRIIIKLI